MKLIFENNTLVASVHHSLRIPSKRRHKRTNNDVMMLVLFHQKMKTTNFMWTYDQLISTHYTSKQHKNIQSILPEFEKIMLFSCHNDNETVVA